MTRKVPWEGIAEPEQGYNVRLVASGLRVPLYWGRDSRGRCLFIVGLEGDNNAQFRRLSLSVKGVAIDLRLVEGNQALMLTLGQQVDRDLFASLCGSLAESLASVLTSEDAINVTFAHLRRWKAFLAGGNARLLPPEQVRGLFAELYFLSLMLDRFEDLQAIASWHGPLAGQQDFHFGSTAVEVKATSALDRNTVRISSEDQLELTSGQLFLAVLLLHEAPDLTSGLSLNDMVQTISSRLCDPEATESFLERVACCGYVEIPAYDVPRFEVGSERAFVVRDSFPRLVRSALPQGVRKVRYQIEIEHLGPFAVPFDSVWE